MNRAYTFGFIFLGLGLTIVLGSTSDWWPATMPNILHYALLTLGFEFIGIGVIGAGAGFANDHLNNVVSRYFLKLYSYVLSIWNGMFVLVFFVSVLSMTPLIIDEVKSSGPSTYMFVEYPSQMDFANGHLHFTFFVINNTDSPSLLDDFRVLDVSTNTKLYGAHDAFRMCSDPEIIKFRTTDDRTNPAGSLPITVDAGTYSLRVLRAEKVVVGTTDYTKESISLDPRRATRISVIFEAGERSYDRFNTTVTCPSFKVVAAIKRKEVVCPGAVRVFFPIGELRERSSQLPKEYENFTLESSQRGFGVIYSTDARPKHITENMWQGYCQSG